MVAFDYLTACLRLDSYLLQHLPKESRFMGRDDLAKQHVISMFYLLCCLQETAGLWDKQAAMTMVS